MGQPLFCWAADAGMWGERGYGDGSTPYAWLSSIALLPWLPSFPPQAFPTTVSSLTSPLSVSLQSTAALTLGLIHNPWTPAPSCCTFQGTCVPVQGMYGCSKNCLILIPFRLPQISCFTLSFKCFSSDSDNCLAVGIRPLLQFAYPLKAGSVLLTSLFSPPSSFLLPSFAWFYKFFSASQVLLSALSWCSACTVSVSECVFLMYPWREMYSMPTYSSTILFPSTSRYLILFPHFPPKDLAIISQSDYLRKREIPRSFWGLLHSNSNREHHCGPLAEDK